MAGPGAARITVSESAVGAGPDAVGSLWLSRPTHRDRVGITEQKPTHLRVIFWQDGSALSRLATAARKGLHGGLEGAANRTKGPPTPPPRAREGPADAGVGLRPQLHVKPGSGRRRRTRIPGPGDPAEQVHICPNEPTCRCAAKRFAQPHRGARHGNASGPGAGGRRGICPGLDVGAAWAARQRVVLMSEEPRLRFGRCEVGRAVRLRLQAGAGRPSRRRSCRERVQPVISCPGMCDRVQRGERCSRASISAMAIARLSAPPWASRETGGRRERRFCVPVCRFEESSVAVPNDWIAACKMKGPGWRRRITGLANDRIALLRIIAASHVARS